MEKLFVMESFKDEKQYIIGELVKRNNGEYEYVPTCLAQQSSFTWTRLPFKSYNLPLYVKQRVFSEHNSGIDKFLKKINLNKYDEWEVLKRTNGRNPRDTLQFVTEIALSKEQQMLKNNTNNYKAKRVIAKKNNPHVVISHGIVLNNLELKRRSNYIVARVSKNTKRKSYYSTNQMIDNKIIAKKGNLFKSFMTN